MGSLVTFFWIVLVSLIVFCSAYFVILFDLIGSLIVTLTFFVFYTLCYVDFKKDFKKIFEKKLPKDISIVAIEHLDQLKTLSRNRHFGYDNDGMRRLLNEIVVLATWIVDRIKIDKVYADKSSKFVTYYMAATNSVLEQYLSLQDKETNKTNNKVITEFPSTLETIRDIFKNQSNIHDSIGTSSLETDIKTLIHVSRLDGKL